MTFARGAKNGFRLWKMCQKFIATHVLLPEVPTRLYITPPPLAPAKPNQSLKTERLLLAAAAFVVLTRNRAGLQTVVRATRRQLN